MTDFGREADIRLGSRERPLWVVEVIFTSDYIHLRRNLLRCLNGVRYFLVFPTLRCLIAIDHRGSKLDLV